MRSLPGSRRAAALNDSPAGSGGSVYMSPGKLPATASSSSAASATLRASGPLVDSPARSGLSGPCDTPLRVGLISNGTHTLDGILLDPRPALPCAAGASPAATAAAAPPLDPPADR